MKPASFLLCSLIATVACPAQAEGWHFIATPYFMVPTMDGKAAVGLFDTQVSTSPADIFSNLNWGVMGTFELNNGRWGVAVDATYMNLDVRNDGGRLDLNGHQGAYTGMLLYRVHKYAELYAGARLNSIGMTLDGAIAGRPVNASRNKNWVDPLIGVRATLPFSPTFDLTVLAEFGGFGIGSDYSAQVWPSLGWRFNDSMKAMVGYRMIYADYKTGSGASRFVYDVATFGPTFGIQIRF